MNKAYLLVVCLLAASFTGCLSNDTSNLEEQQNTEDETIEPVGTHNNETHDYDILIGEIQNLTDEIDNLNEQIDILSEDLQSLESYRYNPPENSSKILTSYRCMYEHNVSKSVCKYDEELEIIKEGNKITLVYIGARIDGGMVSEDVYSNTSSINCTREAIPLTFMDSAGVTIGNYPYSVARFFEADSSWNVHNECGIIDYNADENDYWSSMSIVLPEEPVRVSYGNFNGGVHGASFTFE